VEVNVEFVIVTSSTLMSLLGKETTDEDVKLNEPPNVKGEKAAKLPVLPDNDSVNTDKPLKPTNELEFKVRYVLVLKVNVPEPIKLDELNVILFPDPFVSVGLLPTGKLQLFKIKFPPVLFIETELKTTLLHEELFVPEPVIFTEPLL